MRLDRLIITAFLFAVVWPAYMGGRMLWFWVKNSMWNFR